MAKLVSKWNYPTTVRFGDGRISELAEACLSSGIKKPLFVTDPGLAKMPIVANALKVLSDNGIKYGLFHDVQPNPVAANVEAGIAVVRKGKHDGVIAFGGGSALDAAKVIAFMAGQTRPMWDFEDIELAIGGPAPTRRGYCR